MLSNNVALPRGDYDREQRTELSLAFEMSLNETGKQVSSSTLPEQGQQFVYRDHPQIVQIRTSLGRLTK